MTWLLGATGSTAPTLLGDNIAADAVPISATPVFELNFTDDPIARYRDVVMGAFPVSYWRLGDTSGINAIDESGYGRHGVYTGGVTLNQASNLGDGDPAASFDGSNDHVAVGAYSGYFATKLTTAYSIAAWVNPDTLVNSGADVAVSVFAFAYPGSGDIPFALNYGRKDDVGVTDARFWGGFYVASTGWDIVADNQPYDDAGRWTHLVLTWFQNPDTLVLYRDGQEVARRTPINNVSPGSAVAGAYIGRRWDGTLYLDGRVDDVAVFDYELSPVQVAKMYASGPSREDKSSGYIDLTSRIREFSTRRGRSTSVGRVEAGSLTVILGNLDGALSPDPIVNLLENPSGEQATWDGTAFRPDGWTATDSTLASIPDATASVGRRSMTITTTTAAAALASPGGDTGGVRNNLVAGGTYTWSASVKVATGGGIALSDVRLDFVYRTASGYTTVSSGNPGSLDAWQRLEVTATLPVGTIEAFMRLRVASGGVAGRVVRFDGAQLEEAASASAYCDGDQTGCRWNSEPHRSMSHRAIGYANIIPGRLARLRARYAWGEYGVIDGSVDQWRFKYPGGGVDSIVELTITDGFKELASQNFAAFRRPVEAPADRVRAALRAAAVPEDKISIDDTEVVPNKLVAVAGTAESGSADASSPLTYIRAVEETERGLFYIDRDGHHVYEGVYHRPGVLPTGKLTDLERTYVDLPITIADGDVKNDLRITAGDPTASTVRQVFPASIRRYYPRSEQTTQLWVSELSLWSGDASVAQPRVDSIPIYPGRDPAVLWPLMLDLEISDKLEVERHPRGGADVLAAYLQTVEGINHTWTPSAWQMSLVTSPSVTDWPYVQRPSNWNTQIARPRLLIASNSSPLNNTVATILAETFTAGCFYVLNVRANVTSGSPPGIPTVTTPTGGAWTFIRSDTFGSFTSVQSFYFVPTASFTEAVTLTYPATVASIDWAINEFVEGAAGIGATNHQTFASSTTGSIDVGTLANTRSIVLAYAVKNTNASVVWTNYTEQHERVGPGSIAVAGAYGTPGRDGDTLTWSLGETWAVQTLEILSDAELITGG